MMGQTSAIEWTDATWNPWQGCTKVSPACAHCYMFREMKRYGKDPAIVRRSMPSTFRLPLKQKRTGEHAIPSGWKIFVCSWSDFFHEWADAWRDDAWEIMRTRRDVVYQLVTKRPERILDHLPADWGEGWPHVWVGTTVEDQERAKQRLPILSRIPAAVRWVSYEPALGPIKWGQHLKKLDWIVCGGESGPQARPMHPDWARSTRDECQAAGVSFFFKQWGEWHSEASGNYATGEGQYRYGKVAGLAMLRDGSVCLMSNAECPAGKLTLVNEYALSRFTRFCRRLHNAKDETEAQRIEKSFDPGYQWMQRIGRDAAGRELDGCTWDEFPQVAS